MSKTNNNGDSNQYLHANKQNMNGNKKDSNSPIPISKRSIA